MLESVVARTDSTRQVLLHRKRDGEQEIQQQQGGEMPATSRQVMATPQVMVSATTISYNVGRTVS